MADNRNSYNSILKAIGLFGGVKVFQILVSVIKNKCVAILLGPVGMGIVGMIISSTSMVSTFTGFGLSTSSVRDISAAHASCDQRRIGRIVAVLRKLVWATGILGIILTICLAKQLSIWSFGNEDYTVALIFVSIILLLDQLCIGQTALMQGTFHYRYLANASLWGSVVGLIVSIPLYYIWGVKAIVPVIIITSVANLTLSALYSRKIPFPKEKITFKDILTDGRTMIVLGVALALTATFRLGGSYLQRIFISNIGTIEDVGLFLAGSAIATQYIDIILNAMSTDYAPRLSAIADDNDMFVETINRQAKLLVTIVVPLIIVAILFVREMIIILYSSKFLVIIGMIEWMMFAMLLRAVSWCLSYSFVARGDSNAFFWNETICVIYNLVFSVLGYKFGGFTGLGFAFVATYIFYTFQMYFLGRKRFKFRFDSETMKLLVKQLIYLTITFCMIKLCAFSVYRYVLGSLLLFVSCYLSYKDFDKMIPVKPMLETIKNKFLKKQLW